MYSPKQFAFGVAVLCLAALFTRSHYRRWRDRFADCFEEYWRDRSRGYVLPVVIIAFLYVLGGATVYASFVPGGQIYFTTSRPFVYVTSGAAR